MSPWVIKFLKSEAKVFIWRTSHLILLAANLALGTGQASVNANLFGISRCSLRSDSSISEEWPRFCPALQIELTRQLRQSASNLSSQASEQETASYSELYLGSHLNSYMSAHLKSSLRRRTSPTTQEQSQQIRNAYLQIGHPLFSPFSFSIGKLMTPFGLRLRASSESLRPLQLQLWPDPGWGYISRYSPTQEIRMEFGQSYTETPEQRLSDRPRPSSRSFRLSRSLTALEGTMILLSAREEVNDQRWLGAAITNQSNGRASSIEWVRRLNPKSSGMIRFEQIFRVNYFSVIKERNRWFLEYEQSRKDYWLLNYGIEYFFWNNQFRLVGESTYRHDPKENTDDSLVFQLSAKLSYF